MSYSNHWLFLGRSHDVINCVNIRSQTEKQKVIGWKSMMSYFNRKRVKQKSM